MTVPCFTEKYFRQSLHQYLIVGVLGITYILTVAVGAPHTVRPSALFKPFFQPFRHQETF